MHFRAEQVAPGCCAGCAQDDLVRTVAQTDAILANDSMTLRLWL
jgi:hypothetical protein